MSNEKNLKSVHDAIGNSRNLLTSSTDKLIEKIAKIKTELGSKLLILTHHYQRKEIVDLCDYKGDSFALSKKATEDDDVEYIVFCGVHFMAESAAILAKPHQTVQIPEVEAGCWMADMLDHVMLNKAWEDISAITGPDRILPIVYVNSDAYIKAFCGRHHGLTCTSSNAAKAFEWGFKKYPQILFLPDQHLGRNTGIQLGIPEKEMIVWDPEKPLGGNQEDEIRNAKIILWHGYCLVHTRFTLDHIEQKRKLFPTAKIIVHPECTKEVVQAADAVGSTSFIANYVKNATANTTIVIGTEINLIHRLAIKYPEKQILELHHSLCPNMFKINLHNLFNTLSNIGKYNVVQVAEDIKQDARTALERMLALK